MNHANAKMRDRTAVDCLNSALLLLKMEGDCFKEQHAAAWAGNSRQLESRCLTR